MVFLTRGQLCTGLNKGFLKLNSSTIQLASQSSIDTLSGDITTINSEITSLKSSVSNGKSLIAAAVTDKGVPTAASDSFTTMSNNIKSIETKEYSGPAPLTGILAVGATVTFDSKSWIVMHNDSNVWYLGFSTVTSSITFGIGDHYSETNLLKTCNSWLSENLSDNALNYCIDVTIDDATSKVFVATQSQLETEWDIIKNYYVGRLAKAGGVSSGGGNYWISGSYGYYPRYIDSNALIRSWTGSMNDKCGFRPFIAIQV